MGFDDIKEDASVEWSVVVTSQLIDGLADVIRDHNPVHMSDAAAVEAGFERRLLHGVGLLGIISSAVAHRLPGPGSLLLKMDAAFIKPAYVGDELFCSLAVAKKYKASKTIRFSYSIHNSLNSSLARGELTVLLPVSEMLSINECHR